MEADNKDQELKHATRTKRYVAISLIVMFILSVYVAWTMSQNYKKADSKERFRLTKLYKEYKKKDYQYSQTKGAELYQKLCLECHKQDGLGSPELYPPLKNSKIVTGNFQIPLHIILHGLNGPKYSKKMPSYKKLHPEDIAHILNYIRNEYNQIEEYVHPVEVIKTQVKTIERKQEYTAKELNEIED